MPRGIYPRKKKDETKVKVKVKTKLAKKKVKAPKLVRVSDVISSQQTAALKSVRIKKVPKPEVLATTKLRFSEDVRTMLEAEFIVALSRIPHNVSVTRAAAAGDLSHSFDQCESDALTQLAEKLADDVLNSNKSYTIKS